MNIVEDAQIFLQKSQKPIAIIGMMGSGKSAIGAALAKMLSVQFIDIDSQIEIQESMKISDIFASKGEEYFRVAETNLLQHYYIEEKSILALGGGAVVNNMHLLTKNCLTIFLNPSIEILLKRLVKSSHRPLIANLDEKSLRIKIEYLLQNRIVFYESADIIVNFDEDFSVRKNCMQILQHINNFASLHFGQ